MRPLPPSLIRALESQGEELTVLVVRLGALGDILRTLPPVRLLRRALPRARIYWVLEEKWRIVLDGHPDLDGLVTMPRKLWREQIRSPAGWVGLTRSVAGYARELRRLDGDLLLDFHGNLRSGVSAWLSRTPVRVGYSGHQQKEGNARLTTHHCPSGSRRTPRMERNLDLLRALGLPDGPLPDGGLRLVATGRTEALRIEGDSLGGASRYAVISPGASAAQAYKKPPPGLLVAAGRALARAGVAVLVVWGPGEEPDARRVVEELDGVATLAPPTDLPTLAALLERAALFVGGDSGPLHLACSVGCPVIGLYGPTDPQVNRPWGRLGFSVYPRDRGYTGIKRIDREAGGFEGLAPDQVEAAIERLLPQIEEPS